MNFLKIPKYQLYLLQLENYELGRYFKLLLSKGLFPKPEQRKDLVWTMKARVFFLGALALHILLTILLFSVLSQGFSVLSIKYLVLSLGFCILLYTLYFILYTFVSILLWPLDFVLKQIIVSRAKSSIFNLQSSIKIIGIAGSYGKTTMKEVLKTVLSTKYSVLSAPESVNTPVGIARFILNEVSDETLNHSANASGTGQDQILIIEMGEHYKGDVKEICKISQPDIAVVTGINESHLERMGSLDKITETIFEVAQNSKPEALVLLNRDDENIEKNFSKFVLPGQQISQYEVSGIKQKTFNAEDLCWDLTNETVGRFHFGLLGEYGLGIADCAIQVSLALGLTTEQIKTGLETVKPVSHRLQPIKSSGDLLIIDDAYNGNPEGVKEAIKLLSRFTSKRKVYITPGLVEMGSVSKSVHLEIGRQLANVADLVILIKNSVTPWVEEGMQSVNQKISKSENQIIYFNSAPEAHSALKDILKPGDVVVFQNDWGDQYQ